MATTPLLTTHDSANGAARVREHDALKWTDAEKAAGVTPVNYAYVQSPKIDVRRHLTAWDDGSDQTAGLQTAINMAYANKGRLILPHGLDVTSDALSLTMGGNRATQGFAIEGPGWNGAKITQTGSPTALLTIAGSTPSSNPNEAPIVLEGFSLQGVGKTCVGLLLNGVGYWRLTNVQARGFGTGFHLKSALLGVINGNCMANENNYGLIATRDGASPFPAGGTGCNRITVADSIFNLNTTFGLYLESGANWVLRDLDLEANGTAGDANTGGIRITSGVDDDFGYAIIALKGLWMEGNHGTPLLVDAASGLTLSIRDTLMLNSGESHIEISIGGADFVSIKDTFAPSGAGSVWDITTPYLSLNNARVGTLTDSGVTYPHYRGLVTGTGAYIKGKPDSYTGTLTGCTTSPTATIFVNQDGDEIEIRIGSSLTGTSNTTSCWITDMPVRYRPSAQRAITCVSINNGVEDVMRGLVETDGTIKLRPDTTFTNAGQKGTSTHTFKFRQ